MGKHTSRQRTKGTVAIVAGVAVAVVGAGVLIHGLSDDGGTDGSHNAVATTALPPTGSSTPATRHSTRATSKHPPSAHHSRSTDVLPKPTGNSKPVTVANPAGAACIPKSLTVTSVGIGNERVVPMGTNSQGQIYPPAHTTMWYDRSTQPGQNGISVIAGHVTYDGPDNFYNLRNVPVGAGVTVTCSNDKVVRLTVTHKESVLKTKLTTDQRVWGSSPTPVVTLVTCDIASPMVDGHHLNNYVVWTKPA